METLLTLSFTHTQFYSHSVLGNSMLQRSFTWNTVLKKLWLYINKV